MKLKTLRLILGDQLNHQHSWFETLDDSVCYVMMEVRQETDYVVHHIQKMVAFFSAMRSFSSWLSDRGHASIYLTLDKPENSQSLTENLSRLIKDKGFTRFEYMYPDEYRVQQQLESFCEKLEIEYSVVDSEHFLIPQVAIANYFEADKSMVMENFYRKLRRQYSVLMKDDKPLGNKWNYDKENRKKLPKGHTPVKPKLFSKNVSEIVNLLQDMHVKSMGSIDADKFIWPTTRKETLALFNFFLKNCLPDFGTYQDALAQDHWSVYHARISFGLNVKLISPLEIIRKTEQYWEKHQDQVSLAQVEGFIRQILGWREFMRGLYWINMPDYAVKNHFKHTRKLPEFFWSGDADLNCLKQSISQSLEYAYAHHIQRLMVTGNYMLLTETDPDAADNWYLGIYIDALEWVEMPNTRGMSQFADGGLVATKPYISSANYINKMGDYCKHCRFDPKQRVGDDACPFNSLYWRFLDK
ncbi:MAG: cryptochrome/photolyase family protein, partial [Gammaproteobacteria bacterium]|nr:cryptochrome/photolyase family protein [Gammaproteobacteria bacterium]NNM14568.1 cryptochrome/photolyase family protein [Gammaproteobacteria bacterium]